MADPGTEIGHFVSIGPNVRRFGAAHPIDDLTMHPYAYNPALGFVSADHDVTRTGCVIGHDTWIGANVTILPGCTQIGQGAVIGAGSVVTKDVPEFAIALGNPATVRKFRLSAEQRARLQELDYGRLTPTELIRIAETAKVSMAAAERERDCSPRESASSPDSAPA